MSLIDKKFSDFQKSECDDLDVDVPIEEELCPTCIPDPNFKLDDYWYRIPDAYLHKGECEYRVNISSKEFNNLRAGQSPKDEEILKSGCFKILAEFDKLINSQTLETALDQSFIARKQADPFAGGAIYYEVSVSAFVIDRLPSNKEDKEEDVEESFSPEIIFDHNQIFEKLIILRGGLRLYSTFYSAVAGAGNVSIFYVDNPSMRINYNNIVKDINNFIRDFNKFLDDNKFEQIDFFPSVFRRRKRAMKYKFVMDETPFSLKEIWVRTEDCGDEYEQVFLPPSNDLHGPIYQTVYAFLSQIDTIVSDITAKETKPWAEFTKEYVYPRVEINYGDVDSLPSETALQCLFESSLGLGKGKLVDSLAREAMSIFRTLEDDLYKEMCREIQQQTAKNPQALAEEKQRSAYENRKATMQNRFANEFVDYVAQQLLAKVQEMINSPSFENFNDESQNELKSATTSNIFIKFDKLSEEYGFDRNIESLEYAKRGSRNAPSGKRFPPDTYSFKYVNETGIRTMSKTFGALKFEHQDQYGDMNAFRNSPHWADAQDTWNETFGKDNSFLDLITGERNGKVTPEEENEYKELHWLIRTIGLCGISKSLGKLLKCLAGGVSIDDFYDVVIDTMIEALSMKDLARLFNIIPASMRMDLEKVIEEQFGGTSLTNLLGLATESGQRASDFVKFSDVGKIISIFDKVVNFTKSKYPGAVSAQMTAQRNYDFFGRDSVLSDQEKTFLQLNLGNKDSVFLKESWTMYIYPPATDDDDKIVQAQIIETPGGTRTYDVGTKLKKYTKKYISNARRSYLAGLDNFAKAGAKVQGALSLGSVGRQNENLQAEIDGLTEQLQIVENNLVLANQSVEQAIQAEIDISAQYAALGRSDEYLAEGGLMLDGTPSSLGGSPRDVGLQIIELARLDAMDVERRKAEIESELKILSAGPTPEEQENKRTLQANERAAKALKETNLGVKIDVVFDVAFGYAIDYMLDLLSVDKMIQELSKYPGGDIAIGFIVDFFKSCPNVSLYRPPVKDFLKTFSLDVCDPEIRLTVPRIEIPNLSLKFKFDKKFQEIFQQAVVKIISDIAISLINRVAKMLEDLVCNLAQTLGTLAVDFLEDGEMSNSWYDALDAAFCNGATDPATGEKLAKQMADALVGQDPSKIAGTSSNIGNIIGGVTTQDEILRAMVDGDERVNRMVSNAIKTLAPEFAAILGSPDKVAMFFKNIGSYLSPDDRKRIRDLLDAGVPNLPISAAICLTDEQLDQWNNLRKQLLQQQGFSPEDAAAEVAKLNDLVKDELARTMGDALELDTDAPFIGAIADEIINGTSASASDASNTEDGELSPLAATVEDQCAPNSIFNDNSMTAMDKDIFREARKNYMESIKGLFKEDSFSKDGVFGHALKDTEGRIGFNREWYKFWDHNYQNSAEERRIKYENSGVLKRARMDGRNNGEVEGNFPDTVGLYLKENIESGESLSFNSVSSFSIAYQEGAEPKDQYKSEALFENLNSTNNFSYRCKINEFEGGEATASLSSSFNVNVPISDEEIKYLSSLGVSYESTVPDEPLRKGCFIKYVNSEIPFETESKGDLYNLLFESFGKTIVNSMFHDRDPKYNNLPYGFQFGYEPDSINPDEAFIYLTPDGSREYDLPEEDQVLGKYNHPRVIALDPKLYGGRYSKPPFAVDPVKHRGWLEIATRAWEPMEGCDPYNPPVFDFEDIYDREDTLESTMVNYPELTKDEDCRLERPFKLLVDKTIRARMDSTVRLTVRAYVAEYFLKSLGVFSNVEYNSDNFDNSCIDYIVTKMKEEMIDIGSPSASRRLRIKRESYWYTFLEQVVQSYITMIDRQEVVQPPDVEEAMEQLYKCQINFSKIGSSTKKNMRIRLKDNGGVIRRINDISRREEFLKLPTILGLQAMAWRLSSQNETFFEGGLENGISPGDVRFARLSKIQFFAKILAIAMYEKECKIILREFIKVELERIQKSAFSGFTFKSSIFDLNKSMVGLPLLFEESTSNIGYNSYYLEKQTQEGPVDTGDIPNVTSNIDFFGDIETIEEPKFIVQKYVRMKERVGVELPDFIKNRPMSLVGVSSLEDVSDFFEENLDLLDEKYVSDYFGDLEFTYKSKISELFNKGFKTTRQLEKILPLNEDLTLMGLSNLIMSHTMNRDFDDIEVIHTGDFLLENETKDPHGTTGSTGIRYGIRISVLVPSSFTRGASYDELEDQNFKIKCEREKAYLFKDGKLLLPLVSEEYDLVDSKLVDFDPLSGIEPYDLECAVNKLVKSSKFKIMFNKIFPLTMFSSAASLYSFEGFMPSIGQSESERSENFRGSKRGAKELSNEWAGTVNRKQKKFLRREFASLYLSSKYDGQLSEDLFGEDRVRLFKLTNPFANLRFDISFALPWWIKRRLKTLDYDANGENCADPLKDFQ